MDENEFLGVKRLYQAVLIQAFKDAQEVGKKQASPDRITVQKSARAFLTRYTQGLRFICDIADICPYVVMKAGGELQENGWKSNTNKRKGRPHNYFAVQHSFFQKD